MLAIWRFFLGVGCGGVYPLAATLTAESTASQTAEYRAKLVALTFSMQGVGYLSAPSIAYVLVLGLGEESDLAWRALLGMGCIPGLFLLFNRLFLKCKGCRRSSRDIHQETLEDSSVNDLERPLVMEPETSASSLTTVITEDGESSVLPFDDDFGVNVEVQSSIDDNTPSPNIFDHIRREENIVIKLCGTAGTWFLFDVLFYGNALFERVILTEAFGDSETVSKAIQDQIIIALIALPGYFISVAAVGQISPKYIQIQGFFVMAILYAVIGFFFECLKNYRCILVALYGLTFFFANFGPNATTFMLPSLTFSSTCRSTLNGVSAASGKTGALLGATAFAPLAEHLGDQSVMIICAAISVVGLIISGLCVQELKSDDTESTPECSGRKESRRRKKAKKLMYGPLRNGEIDKSFQGSEFWRRRNFSVPSFIDFDDSNQ